MSLFIPIPSSSSSNGPTTTTLTTRGLCPGSSVVWAGSKFVWPHRWGSWVMVRFRKIQGHNCREILHRPPPKQSNICFLSKKKNSKENAHLHQRNQVFPISNMEKYWTGSSWPVYDEFRLVWECRDCGFETESFDLNWWWYCFYWHSWRNNVVIAFGTLSFFSYLASHSEWCCLRCLSFCRWWKT